MIANRDIRLALYEKSKSARLTLFCPDTIDSVSHNRESATISLSDGCTVSSRLVVSAEGFKGTLAGQCGIRHLTKSYDRTALVSTLQTEKGHANIAYEHFTPAGPLALLPLVGDRLCMVWVDTDAQTRRRHALPPSEFVSEIHSQLGDQFGKLEPVGRAHTYPLGLAMATRLSARRFVLVGDSAHKIHPVAGQGLNLGLKDVAALISVLTTARKLGQDIGSAPVLLAYSAWRAPEIAAMTAFTDGCVRLFESEDPLLRAGRQMAAGIIRRQSMLRRLLVDAAGGALAPVPKLMKAS
jgi:2-octaprenyl-6-methoxyphenol hydroxylase